MNWDWDKLRKQQQKQGYGKSNKKDDGEPPQVEELFKQFGKFPKMSGGIWIVVFFIAAAFGLSLLYKVEVNEVGVVQRFGEFKRIEQPGLNIKWPFGIEKVTKIKAKKIWKDEFGFETRKASSRTRFSSGSDGLNVSLMLTGDLNVAVVPWIVQYKIKDPYNYLFKVKNIKGLLKDMSEAAMRQVVGDISINEVITKREELAIKAQEILQKELDIAEAGIDIKTIEMKKTNVPGPVQSSFNEVNQAVQEKERLIYKAQEDYNKAIPAAKGNAERTIRGAEGYKLDRINRAKGDASRFTALYNEYSKAKDVTKRRLYLETIKDVFPKLGPKYIIDSDQKNFLPLLNIQKENGVIK